MGWKVHLTETQTNTRARAHTHIQCNTPAIPQQIEINLHSSDVIEMMLKTLSRLTDQHRSALCIDFQYA